MKFLLDANIPKGIAEFEGDEFIQVYQWGDGATDTEIWNYALDNNYIIITRDTDFYFRLITASVYPKIIFLNLQQVNKADFKKFIQNKWYDIVLMIENADMLIVDLNTIQLVKK